MDYKKIILIVATLLIATSSFTLPARAANGTYTCTVVKAGPTSDGKVLVMLTDTGGKFTRKWFTCSAGQENRMLATALAAFSNVVKVSVYTDYTKRSTNARIIYKMYITE